MDKFETLEKQKFIFGSLFLLSNKLQVIMDRDLAAHGLTTKQWFMTAVLEEFFDTPPTLGELAKAMGTSHQNVKQIALKLQEKEFLQIEKDQEDRRAIRLRLTEKCFSFWETQQQEAGDFLNGLFKEFKEEELYALWHSLNKLFDKIETIEKSLED